MNNIEEKLRKLFAKQCDAEKIGNEGEAQAAVLAINRILVKYNIENFDFTESTEKKIKLICVPYINKYKWGGTWESCLLNNIARYNFCKVYKYGDEFRIIGEKGNIEIVERLNSFCREAFVILGKRKFFSQYEVKWIDTFLRSYLMGCALGLGRKLEEERKRETTPSISSDCVKLTVVANKVESEIKKFAEEEFGGAVRKGRKQASLRNTDILIQGFSDGKSINIHSGELSNNTKFLKV